MAIKIKGEAGKDMDATSRTLAELQISDWSMRYASMADDRLAWTADTKNARGVGTVIPEADQVVELWEGTNRVFKGWVRKPRVRLKSVAVEVLGPWMWLEKVMLTGTAVDDTGDTDDRAFFVAPAQSLQQTLKDLIDRFIAIGIPISRGTVAEAYDCPPISLRNMSCAAALGQLMALLTDAVVAWDYTDNTPALNIFRRKPLRDGSITDIAGGMNTDEWEVGADRILDLDIYPRLDQVVERVELKYLKRRAGDGKKEFKAQTSGTGPGLGKLQVVTLSGNEIGKLPKDDLESTVIRAYAIGYTGAFAGVTILRDPFLNSIYQEYGVCPGNIDTSITFYTATGVSETRGGPALKFTQDSGRVISTWPGKYIVVSNDLPDWAKKQYGGVDVTVSGTWITTDPAPYAAVHEAMRPGADWGFGYEDYSLGTATGKFYYVIRPFSYKAVLINTEFLAETTVYKAWDFNFTEPPAGMAAGLRETQNWTPYEGRLVMVNDVANFTFYNGVKRTVNVANAYPKYATMRAMVKSCEYAGNGRITYELGAPARTGWGAMQRVRTDPADNYFVL